MSESLDRPLGWYRDDDVPEGHSYWNGVRWQSPDDRETGEQGGGPSALD